MSAAPPAFLRRLLERSLPEDVREGIVGDLDEVYATRRSGRGRFAADLWYAGQAVAISGRFVVERVRGAFSERLAVGPDLKLGLRMLVKHPALTVVAGLAIAVATSIGVGASEFVKDLLDPRLPLERGERIVRLLQVDTEAGGASAPTLWDLDVWEESLSSMENLGAYVTLEQGLVSDRGEVGTVNLARITASGLELTGVSPRMGRSLVAEDERPDAPPVVVLGHDAWQRLLGGAPDVVGRTVHLGGTPTTVVGVMPEGYGFPSSQNAWVPLRMERSGLRPENAPQIAVFGLLAPGATLEGAQAELEVAGRRAAADHPGTYERLLPTVEPFAGRATGGQMALILSIVRLLFVFLLVVVCANVATLVFARTVGRQGEIAIRRSLGASRPRIVLQLFAEALVLVVGPTLLGLAIAQFALGPVSRLFFTIQQEAGLPFWWDHGLSAATVVYALVLALVGAVMVGVVPALKATGGEVQPRLGALSAGGGGGLRFGGMWTVIIVLQVALSVAFLPVAVSQASVAFENPEESGFPAESYVTAQLGRDPVVPPRTPEEEAAFLGSTERLFREVRDRVAADPAVAGAALASGLSAMNHLGAPVEVVGDGDAPSALGWARVLLVDPGYLDLMGAEVLAGRTLGQADRGPESRSVLVNEAFVENVLAGRSPVGGQLRFPERDPRSESSLVEIPAGGSTVEVVGVVRDPGIDMYGPGAHAAIYAPLDLAPVTPRAVGLVGMPQAPAVQLFVRLRSDTEAMAGRLYATVNEVDPSLRLSELGTAADAWGPARTGARIGGWIFLAVAGIVLMLSVAGIYALMSFTVSRRTREIAIRSALGARRGRIVGSVFRRAVTQLMGGVALGSFVAVPVLLDGVADDGLRSLVIVALVLLGAGTAACYLPVRRALRIEPAAAMKSE